MHGLDWNDLRFVIAVARGGSHAAAARALRVDPTTVGRRITQLEAALSVPLFSRDARGNLVPTEAGALVCARSEQVETTIGDLKARIGETAAEAAGTVRLTAVPIVVNHLLVPGAAPFLAQHPRLRLEIVADTRDLNLTRRDADMAIRLARPDAATGSRLLARRLGALRYGVYAAREVAAPETLPWITYEPQMADLPQAAWLAGPARPGGAAANIALNDADGLLAAVRAGLGRSLLPVAVGDGLADLVRLPEGTAPTPGREVWLLTHQDLAHLGRIKAVAAWCEGLLAGG
ncbi:LysR family transcriptional regulator [Acidimangrovimonas sediminis]|uniref:LysR family transcriptional regulator n=1 Tax=Acidimangrovimonas sediminis TaxID=2056283 RepID=UPI000C7F922B|nr:LysR family transcriptional regulator [Acidimangrovimonas sediminis]